MILLNFSHPIREGQLAQIEALAGQRVTERFDISVQLDTRQPFAPQLAALLDDLPISARNWQELSFVINLPGLSAAAGVMLAELHGRMGYFPTIVRMRGVGTPPVYEVAELVNLASVRAQARKGR